jgi:membrane-bound serine protease (ClpP class)
VRERRFDDDLIYARACEKMEHDWPKTKAPLMDVWKKLVPAVLIFLLFPFSLAAKDRIVVLNISGAVTPPVAEYVCSEIRSANAAGDVLVILEVDTPGGLDTAMREIIKEIQGSNVPVAVYVSPGGSRAASAGAFITIASHIAAMAPGTNIGAAHPVNLLGGASERGKEKDTMEEKIVNDAAAYMRSLAEQRGRNSVWAELAVRRSVSISSEEAKRLGVVDLLAGDRLALILALDGREVSLGTKSVVLKTQGRETIVRKMSERLQFLDAIADPNVAYILLMIGLVGLYFELSNPGLILPGVLGGISLVLALYAMQALPVNYAGLVLIFLGTAMFVAEFSVVSHGLLSIGGTVAVVLGSVMLIDSADPAMQISNKVLYPTLVFFAVAAIGVVWLAAKSRRTRAVTGVEAMVGTAGVVKEDLKPEGMIFIHGEMWNAVCEGFIPAGEKVIVQSVEGLKVRVKKA